MTIGWKDIFSFAFVSLSTLFLFQIAKTFISPSWLPATEIDSPGQVEVKDVTDSSALISWNLPVAPVDRVTMFYMPSSDPSDETTVDVSPPNKQYNTDNLRPDTEYTVSIISRRGEATSDPVTTTFTTGESLLKIKKRNTHSILIYAW